PGAGVYTKGWENLPLNPAVNAKQAMRFDYGRLNQTVSALEVGLTEEFYFSKIPLVYLVPQHQFFFNAYVAILFGSRKCRNFASCKNRPVVPRQVARSPLKFRNTTGYA